jgi:membrane-associated phospholipid phosphatase
MRRTERAQTKGPCLKMKRKWVPAAAFFLASMVALTDCRAQESSGLRAALNDTEQYFTSPLRWDVEDWAYFGISAAAVAAAHSFDSRVRSDFATGANGILNGGKDKNAGRDAIPALSLVLGTWATAGFLDDEDGFSETWRLVEAGAFSSVTAEGLALAAGRERPDGTVSPNQWRKRGDSFPSAHTSAAFAIGMTFAESGNDDYRWIRRIVGYAIAGGTAYIRVKDNVHWLSDTVAGAALGTATARFVLNRENGLHGNISLAPQKGGWVVSYNVPLP